MNEIIREKLKDLVASVSVQIDRDSILMESNLIDDLMFDSITMMELVIEIEETFNIELSEDELVMEKFESFEKLCNLVEEKCNA